MPSESGGSATAVSTSAPKVDAGLLGALSELASLSGNDQGAAFERRPTSPGKPKSSSVTATPPLARKRDSLRIVPISTQPGPTGHPPGETLFESPEKVFEQLANLPAAPVDDSPLMLSEPERDEEETPGAKAETSLSRREPARPTSPERLQPKASRNDSAMSADLTDALAELAAPSPNATRSDGTRVEVVPQLATRGESRIRRITGTIALASVAFTGGFLTDRYFSAGTTQHENADTQKSSEGTEQFVLKETITPAETQVIETISGRVTFAGSDGVEKPDALALAMLLPTTNNSSLKLDAGPLRDLELTPARMAIESALGVLGASVVRTDEDGQFRLPRKVSTSATLVIISRHAARPDGESIPTSAQNALSDWLQSPTQLLGRLSVQTQPLSAVAKDTLVPPFKIHFPATK